MKRSILFFLVLATPFLSIAQNAQLKNGFGINQDFHDYNVRLLDSKLTSFDSSLSQSIRLSYSRYLSRTWGVMAGISNGFLLNQTQENKLIRKSYMVGADIDLIFKLNNGTFFKPDAPVAPYLSFGYNFNYLTAHKDLNIDPMVVSNEYGLGFNFRLGPKSNINLMLALDQQLNGDFDTHMQYRLGFAQAIGSEKEEKKDEDKPKDYDNDGIADVDDDCPTLPGISAKGGCPENWAESGESEFMKDSVLARLDALDEIILALKSEVENLSHHRIVKVECADVPAESTSKGKGGQPKQESATSKDTETETVGNTKEITPEETTRKEETPDTGSVDQSPKDETTDKVETPQIGKNDPRDKSDENNPPKIKAGDSDDSQKNGSETDKSDNDGFGSMADHERQTGPKAFYVVVISTKDEGLANRTANLVSNDYPVVRVLPQANGYYRVGVYATKTKSEALKILEYTKHHGVPSAWLSYE